MLLMFTTGAVIGGVTIGLYKKLTANGTRHKEQSEPRLSERVAARVTAPTLPKTKSDPPKAIEPQFVQIELEQLEAIHGIGPAYARRLNAAGIFTYQDLAATSETALAHIVAPDGKRVPPVNRWIEAAHTLGGQTA